MANKTTIANVMCIRLGVTKLFANVETESTPTAKAFRTIFDDERDFVLRDFLWNWAKKYAALGLVDGSEITSTSYDWQYAYRVPADCVYARRISTARAGRQVVGPPPTVFGPESGMPIPPPFELGQDDEGALLFTDEQDAVLEYTSRVEDLGRWDAIARSALAWRLGIALAGSMSRIKGIVDTCESQYQKEIDRAKMHVLNERQDDPPPPSEFERSRY